MPVWRTLHIATTGIRTMQECRRVDNQSVGCEIPTCMEAQEASQAMKVFISYSSQDESAVASMVADLESAQVEVRLGPAHDSGNARRQAILDEIRQCRVFVFALSDHSARAPLRRAEMRYANDLGLPILPVQIGEVSDHVVDPLFGQQFIDYRNLAAATRFQLMKTLHELGAYRPELPAPLPQPPPIPVTQPPIAGQDASHGPGDVPFVGRLMRRRNVVLAGVALTAAALAAIGHRAVQRRKPASYQKPSTAAQLRVRQPLTDLQDQYTAGNKKPLEDLWRA